MKKTIILIGILSLIFVSGLCLFVDHADAAVSYTPSSGALASSTSLDENWVEQMYVLDKAGTLALRTATKTGNDTSPVLHTYAFEPADYIMLGGSNNDFYVTVSGWDATLLNMTVRINGTDFFGAFQTEDILFTGDGTQYTTKAYRTSNDSQVVKWYLSSGSASVSVVVGQGQWGRVWKTSVNSYRFVNATLACSGFYNQTNTTISLYPYSTGAINVGTSGCFIFGNLSDTGVARWGCHFINEKPDTNVSISGSAAVTYLKFYACSFMSYPDNSSNSSLRISETLGMLDIRNCLFSQNSYILNGGTNSIFKRNTFVSAIRGVSTVLGTSGLVNDQFFDNVSIPLGLGTASAFTGSNITVNGYDYLFTWGPIGLTPYVHKFQNFNVLGNLYAQYLGTSTGNPLVQLQYGIQIRTRNQTENLSGAVIKYYQINTSSLVSTLIATVSSGSDGVAPYVFLNRSVWQKNALEPNSNFSVHTWVNLSGYQDVHLNFTMSKEMIFDVVLLPVPNILVLSNLTNATGTNQTYWNGTGFTIWNNATGNTTALTLYENFLDCTGFHEFNLGLLGYNVWANVTGTGGGSTGTNFSMTDPNPANNSMSQTGVYLNNHIMNKPGGLSCAVDIRFQNFTELSEANLGTGILTENYTITDSDDYIEFFISHAKGQTFTMKQTCVLNKVMLSVYKDVGATGTLDVTLHTLTGPLNNLHFSNNLSTGSLDIGSVPLVSAYVNITMTPYVLQNGTKYCIRVSNPGGDGGTPLNIWWNQDTFGSYSDGGYVEYLPMFPSSVFAELARDGMFGIWCWSFGDNITWDHVINLTFKSNSSGTWQQFGKVYALWNGTWSCFNANFSHNNTKYNWSVIPDINGTNYSEQFYTFTTGTNSLIAVLEDHRILYLGIGGTLGGVLTMVCIPYIFVRRRRQEQETTT